MKRTKNFFIALLGFCLMGNFSVKAETTEDGFVYTSYPTSKWVFVTGYSGNSVELKFPKFEGMSVYIKNTFVNNVSNVSNITKVDLSNVDDIASGAFSVSSEKNPITGENEKTGFVSLETVVLGEKVPTVDGNPFLGAPITNLVFSGSVASNFPALASSIVNVDLSNVMTVADNAFQGFSKLETIEGFENVTSIGSYAFQNCSKLTGTLELIGVTSLGDYAFYNTGYNDLYMSKSVSELPKGVFASSNIETVIMSGVSTIGESAFQSCPLISINLSGVSTIGKSAFQSCSSLDKISNLNAIKTIGANAFQFARLTDFTLDFPETLTSLGTNAFSQVNLIAANFKSNPSGVNAAFPGSQKLTLTINDDAKLDLTNQNTYDKVVYTRTINSSSDGNRWYAGMMLPFTPDENDDYVYYRVNEVSSSEVSFVETTPTANTPYLFENLSASSSVEIVATGDVVVGGSDATIITDGYATGVYEKTIVDSYGKFYSIKDGAMTKYTAKLTVKPYRVYWNFSTVSSANFMLRTSRGGETAIDFMEIDNEQNLEQNYYDLTGRKVLNPVKGNIYIVKGKKVVF